MTPVVLADAVANHPFARPLSPAHRRILTACAMVTHFDAGELLFHEGDVANRFYLIQTGQVSLETRGAEGEVIVVQRAGAGDVVGWSWLFPPFYWRFSAWALEPSQAIFFYGTMLRETCEEDSDFGFQLMKRVTNILIQRLEATVKQSLRLSLDPAR